MVTWSSFSVLRSQHRNVTVTLTTVTEFHLAIRQILYLRCIRLGGVLELALSNPVGWGRESGLCHAMGMGMEMGTADRLVERPGLQQRRVLLCSSRYGD